MAPAVDGKAGTDCTAGDCWLETAEQEREAGPGTVGKETAEHRTWLQAEEKARAPSDAAVPSPGLVRRKEETAAN